MRYSAIESIEEVEPDIAYDISNFDSRCWSNDGGNFIVNGIVVHNCIPEYVARRDGVDTEWREKDDPRITAIIGETFNVIVYQESLQAIWQGIAGFTAPQAQEARKAVAKKYKDKLKDIGQQWLDGASPIIGEEGAVALWGKMVTFGRYAFNRSHALAYCLVAFKCLWLKSYYPSEWWAAVMSYCNADKLIRYMNAARDDGEYFASFDINNLSLNFIPITKEPRLDHTVSPNGYVIPGLICLKGVGPKLAMKFVSDPTYIPSIDEDADDIPDEVYEAALSDNELADTLNSKADTVDTSPIKSVDDFVARKGKNKILMERLIKLGAFSQLPEHTNSRAVWTYYLCAYCTGAEITSLKSEIKQKLLESGSWTEQTIIAERARQEKEFKLLYPKRNKIPDKITKWQPKPVITLAVVNQLYPIDFTLDEILKFEEQYLGYHLHSPLDLYVTRGNRSILQAKECGEVEAVISNVHHTKTRNGSPMCRLTIYDGRRSAIMILWANELECIDKAMLRIGRGIRAKVFWDIDRRNFTLNGSIFKLERKNA